MDNNPCGGLDNVDDGCGMDFPRRTSTGSLCPFCKKLKVPGLSEEAKAEIKATMVQCSECGLCGTTISDPCGTCKRIAYKENGIVDIESLNAKNARRRQMEGQLNRPATGATTPLAELSNLRANTLASANRNCFTIFIEVRRSSTPSCVDKILGKTCVPYPETTTFLALKEAVIADINPRWIRSHTSELKPDEAELRARTNITLQQDIDFITLRQWYNIYNVAGVKDVYLKPPPGVKNAKGSAFCLELFIHENIYFERTGEIDSDDSEIVEMSSKAGKKRKGSRNRSENSQVSKRVKDGYTRSTSRVLTSRFAQDDAESVKEPIVASADPIHFKRTICTVNPDDGRCSLTELSTVETGLLDQTRMFLSTADRGKMKDVYSMIIEGKQFVAKKLVDAGDGRGYIPLPDAVRFLSADLVRLKRMEHFVKAFLARGEQEGAELTYFQVSDGFIIKTYAENPGHEPEEQPEDPVDTVKLSSLMSVYLVEPRRASSAVLKFSGALGMPHRFDRRSATIMAFSHYVLEVTACGYMFADIQGSTDRHNLAQNKSALTLFDPMTHTPRGKSGLGDHGPRGLNDFIASHKCTGICSAMNLCSMSDLRATMLNLQDPDSDTVSEGDSF